MSRKILSIDKYDYTPQDLSNIAYNIVSTAPQVQIRYQVEEPKMPPIESRIETEADLAMLMYDDKTINKLRTFVFPIETLNNSISDLTVDEYIKLSKRAF